MLAAICYRTLASDLRRVGQKPDYISESTSDVMADSIFLYLPHEFSGRHFPGCQLLLQSIYADTASIQILSNTKNLRGILLLKQKARNIPRQITSLLGL